jgi:hypothetical protein
MTKDTEAIDPGFWEPAASRQVLQPSQKVTDLPAFRK